jgi:hypothetical protein
MIGVVMPLLAGGAVVTVLIAEAIGFSGAAHVATSGPVRFVPVCDQCIEGSVATGTGWCCLDWMVVDPSVAALNQGMLNNDDRVFSRRPPPVHPDYDAPEVFPRWGRLWGPADWPGMRSDGTIDWGQRAIEAGVGWPLPSMAIDKNIARTDSYGGGAPLAESSSAGLRFLSWRPILTGFVVDTLLWSACLAGLILPIRLWVRTHRRRRWQCPTCRYDLRGLPAGSVCPECGARARVVPAPGSDS